MGLKVNGKALKSISYNGMVIEQEDLKVDSLNFSEWDTGSFSETLSDGHINYFDIEFDQNGRPVKFTDGDGHETVVTWDAV